MMHEQPILSARQPKMRMAGGGAAALDSACGAR
jgi:hypothetical protein